MVGGVGDPRVGDWYSGNWSTGVLYSGDPGEVGFSVGTLLMI